MDEFDELNELPTAFCSIDNDFWLEWVYVVDLDRELFSVNNRIFFDLWNVPRPRWVDAFTYDDNGDAVFSFHTAPEGFEDVEPSNYFDDLGKERQKYLDIGDQYQYLTVKALASFDLPFPGQPQQVIALVLFDQFTVMRSSFREPQLANSRHSSNATTVGQLEKVVSGPQVIWMLVRRLLKHNRYPTCRCRLR